MKANRPFLPFACWTLLMAYALLEPDGGSEWWFLQFPYSDKLLHFGIFAVFAGLLAAAFHRLPERSVWRIALSAVLAWAVATEAMQGLFTATRTADWRDAIADMLGGASGTYTQVAIRKMPWYQRFIQPIFNAY